MNILLAGFSENESGSKLLLDLVSPRHYIDKQYINIQSERWKEALLSRMKRKNYEYLFLVHMKQQPEMKENQVELVALTEDGDIGIKKYRLLQEQLVEQGFLVNVVEETKERNVKAVYQVIQRQQEENEGKTHCLLINIPQVVKIDVMTLSKQMTKYFETLVKAC